MGTAFDLLLVAVIVASVLINYYQGAFKLIKPFKLITALLIAAEFKGSQAVRALIGRFMNFENFRLQLRERLDSMWSERLNSATETGGAVEGNFGWIANKITNISEFFSEAVAEGAHDVTAAALDKASYVAESFFVQLIGFVIIFAVTFLLLTLAYMIISCILKHGILKHINRILGGVAGVMFGFAIAWLVAILLVNIAPMLTSADADSVTGGFFGLVKWFYNDCAFSRLFGITKI